ncbi:MAG: glycoside hydrolase [Clostridiales bacterium]|nr:glycoside hydrolase [Clostridiales bacterium]
MVHVDTLSCEAILRRAPNGNLIIVSQCGGASEPAPQNRVYAFVSRDGGKTWGKPASVWPEDGRAVYATEVSVANGEIRCYLTLHDGRFLDFRNAVAVSRDSGSTWAAEKGPRLGGFCFLRGRLDLPDGGHLLPYQRYPIARAENDELKKRGEYVWHSEIEFVENGVLIGGADGAYRRGGAVRLPLRGSGGKPLWQWPEPTLARLSDGAVAMLLRYNGTGYLWRSDSRDGGCTWSEPVRTDIPNPGNKPKLIQMDARRVALLNTPNAGQGYASRNPLSVWVSADGMKTWGYKRDLTDFPGWLSYPDGIYEIETNEILLAFEFNRHDIYFIRHRIEENV